MEVTRVEIIPTRPNQGLVAFATIEVDNELMLSAIAIHVKLNGEGYRLTYPTKKSGEVNMPLYHPISPTLSKKIEKAIFEKCEKMFA